MSHWDDVVVGAGVVGLAHAHALHALGRRVLVVEAGARAQGASIRNFGMIWPIGQPAGERLDLALRSRELWLEVLRETGVWHSTSGSLHLALHEDEEAVLHELVAASAGSGRQVQMLTAEQAVARAPRVREDRLRAALYSGTELNVDPRVAIPAIAEWLASRGVEFAFGERVVAVTEGEVETHRRVLRCARAWVCTGDRRDGVLHEALAEAPLIASKLQMLSTTPLPADEALGCMLAAGLTLLHYEAFAECPTLPALRARLAEDEAFALREGIHVMVSQGAASELVLGDSHCYGDAIDPFDREDIDEAILGILDRWFDRSGTRIARRWHGTYVKCTEGPWWIHDPDARTTVITGFGGAGMTLSFGIAERTVRERV